MKITGIWYFAVMMGVFANNIAAVNYCKIKWCKQFNKGVHTMCKYKSPTPAKACKSWSNPGLSDAERNLILREHNELRQKVASGEETRGSPGPQPAAVQMPNLTWDSELARIAQRWANQCNYGHDECRDVEKYQVGQNVAYTTRKGNPGLEQMIYLWYDEVALYDKNQVSSFVFSKGTGHYTQMVWAETTKLGCGRISYKPTVNDMKRQYLVCNYGPAGNVLTQRVYEVKQ